MKKNIFKKALTNNNNNNNNNNITRLFHANMIKSSPLDGGGVSVYSKNAVNTQARG